MTAEYISLDDLSDADVLDQVNAIKKDRKHLGWTPTRIVKFIKAQGFAVSVAQYRTAESVPLVEMALWRSGLLPAARRALKADPLTEVHTDAETLAVMRELAYWREHQGFSYEDVSDALHVYSIPISEAEYRSMESGTTKRVPYHVVIAVARILSLDPCNIIADALNRANS